MKSLSLLSCIAPPAIVFCALALTACDKQPAPAPSPSPGVSSAGSSPPAAAQPTPVGESGSVIADSTVPANGSAIETYKTSVREIKAFMEANQNASNPSTALDNLRELVTRISAVETEGLPAELAKAFKAVKTAMQRTQTAFDALPVPVDQLEKWMIAQNAKGGEAADDAKEKMGAFQTTMEEIQKEIEPAAKAMNDAGAKYGVEPLDLNGQ